MGNELGAPTLSPEERAQLDASEKVVKKIVELPAGGTLDVDAVTDSAVSSGVVYKVDANCIQLIVGNKYYTMGLPSNEIFRCIHPLGSLTGRDAEAEARLAAAQGATVATGAGAGAGSGGGAGAGGGAAPGGTSTATSTTTTNTNTATTTSNTGLFAKMKKLVGAGPDLDEQIATSNSDNLAGKYEVGSMVDAMDRFLDRAGRQCYKWRIATVIKVDKNQRKLKVQFIDEDTEIPDTSIKRRDWNACLHTVGSKSTNATTRYWPPPPPSDVVRHALELQGGGGGGGDGDGGGSGSGGGGGYAPPQVPTALVESGSGVYRAGQTIDLWLPEISAWVPVTVIKASTGQYGAYAGITSKVQVPDPATGEAKWVAAETGRLRKTGQEKIHRYNVGNFVDCLHLFRNRLTGEMMSQWRGAEIKAILPDAVYVSFLGWSSTYDTWLHMARHADRIRPLGAKTIAETHEERERKEAEETFVAIMQTCGRTVIKMESDGNCLFRALAHQLYGDPSQHAQVRKAVCDYMEANPAMFANKMLTGGADLDTYLARMRLDREWGGYPEQLAAEELYDRPLRVFHAQEASDGGMEVAELPLHLGDNMPTMPGVSALAISFHHGNHYNSVEVDGDKPPHPPRSEGVIRAHRISTAATASSGSVPAAAVAKLTAQHSFLSGPATGTVPAAVVVNGGGAGGGAGAGAGGGAGAGASATPVAAAAIAVPADDSAAAWRAAAHPVTVAAAPAPPPAAPSSWQQFTPVAPLATDAGYTAVPAAATAAPAVGVAPAPPPVPPAAAPVDPFASLGATGLATAATSHAPAPSPVDDVVAQAARAAKDRRRNSSRASSSAVSAAVDAAVAGTVTPTGSASPVPPLPPMPEGPWTCEVCATVMESGAADCGVCGLERPRPALPVVQPSLYASNSGGSTPRSPATVAAARASSERRQSQRH